MRYLLLCTLLALAVTSCKKEAAVWESDWNAPLVNDTLSFANLVNDSTLTVSNGYYAIDLTRNLFDVSISDLVVIPDTTIVNNYVSAVNLELSPGFTYAGSAETYDLQLGDVQMKTITLEEGFIDVKLENPIETVAYFIIKLDNVTDDNGVFLRTIPAPPASNGQPGVAEATLDLSGYTMDLSGQSGGGYNELVADFSVVTDPNGSSAWIYDGDVTRVEAKFRDVKIFYAQGYFGNTILNDTTSIDLTQLDIYQSGLLDISNLSLDFEVENGIKVGAVANINMVSNTNALNNTVNLMGPNIGTDITVNPATGNWNSLAPSFTTLSFNASNSNIEEYLENLGVNHKVAYKFELNPWGNVSGGWDQVFPQSRVRVKLKAQMPLSIGMDALVLQDTFDLTLNQDPDQTRVVSGDLILKAKNGFPFSANVTMYLLGANGALLHTIQGTDVIESSQYGVLDLNTNVLVQPSEVVFSLSDAVIANVNDVQRVIVRAEMNSPDPSTGVNQQILIPENAFIELKLRSEFKTENRF